MQEAIVVTQTQHGGHAGEENLDAMRTDGAVIGDRRITNDLEGV